MSGSYREIKVWQKAIELVVDIYSCTRSFPREELYGLAGQLRRAAVSIASNIAEGKGRRGAASQRDHEPGVPPKDRLHRSSSRPEVGASPNPL